MADTKICDNCDKEIGQSETACPACGADQAELDELADAVERGTAILEKRKKRATPPAPPAPAPAPQPKAKGLSRFRALGRIGRKNA